MFGCARSDFEGLELFLGTLHPEPGEDPAKGVEAEQLPAFSVKLGVTRRVPLHQRVGIWGGRARQGFDANAGLSLKWLAARAQRTHRRA